MKGQVFEQRCVAMRDEQVGISNDKMPGARKARDSQDLTGMRLAEMPNKGEAEPVENISRG